ncbi:MAG: hypothetical protein AB1630_09695 [bacterium]
MATSKTEQIRIDLPQDVIFAMRGLEKPDEVKKKFKKALFFTEYIFTEYNG